MRTSFRAQLRLLAPWLVLASLFIFSLGLRKARRGTKAYFSAIDRPFMPNKNQNEKDLPKFTFIDTDLGPLDHLPDARPDAQDRKFPLALAEAYIESYASKIADPALRQIFLNSWPNTLDTTVSWHDADLARKGTSKWLPRTFVTTGDIPAMWLRDSAAQIHPYLPLLDGLKNGTKGLTVQDQKDAETLYTMILGVLYQQCQAIIHHPWSNAFRPPFDAMESLHLPLQPIQTSNNDKVRPLPPEHKDSEPAIGHDPPRQWIEGDGGVTVWESKYELDSLAYFLKLGADIAEYSGRTEFVNNMAWRAAVETVISTLESQQRSTAEDMVLSRLRKTKPKTWNEAWDRQWGVQAGGQYFFQRSDPSPTESRALGGRGEPAFRTGLIKSAFRPSDDATLLPFLIPSNALAAVSLERVAKLVRKEDALLYEKLATLASTVQQGISDHGFINGLGSSPVYAYEVDGYGSWYFMDDANVPSLLSMPYFGFVDPLDESYLGTRRLLLSKRGNKYYFAGKAGAGIGGPHVGLDYAWPMSIIMQAITSDDDEEITYCLRLLRRNTAGTGLIHESFNVNVAEGADYTRPWFSWANGLFGELIVKVADTKPHILLQQFH